MNYFNQIIYFIRQLYNNYNDIIPLHHRHLKETKKIPERMHRYHFRFKRRKIRRSF